MVQSAGAVAVALISNTTVDQRWCIVSRCRPTDRQIIRVCLLAD